MTWANYVDINAFVKAVVPPNNERGDIHARPTVSDFAGRCDEALDFYKKAIGAKVGMLMRWKDSPDKTMLHARQTPNKVMHSQFQVGETPR